MALVCGFDAVGEECLKAHKPLDKHGAPEMKANILILLLGSARSSSRDTAAFDNQRDTAAAGLNAPTNYADHSTWGEFAAATARDGMGEITIAR